MECQRCKEINEVPVTEPSSKTGWQSATKGEKLLNKSSISKGNMGLFVEGYPVEGLSIGGQETCVIFPSLKIAFDIGRCPQRSISQDYLFISHGHLDHIGGLPMYVATRGLYRMKPPTIFVPASIKETVERLFDVHRIMDQSELKHNLIGMNVGDEFQIRKDYKVKAFRTYHVIPSQGYIIYSVKQKLKHEYITLSGHEIKFLRLSCVEVTYTVTSPEIAFTGDTMLDFVVDPDNSDVLKARILVMERLETEEHLRCHLGSVSVMHEVVSRGCQGYGRELSRMSERVEQFQIKAEPGVECGSVSAEREPRLRAWEQRGSNAGAALKHARAAFWEHVAGAALPQMGTKA